MALVVISVSALLQDVGVAVVEPFASHRSRWPRSRGTRPRVRIIVWAPSSGVNVSVAASAPVAAAAVLGSREAQLPCREVGSVSARRVSDRGAPDRYRVRHVPVVPWFVPLKPVGRGSITARLTGVRQGAGVARKGPSCAVAGKVGRRRQHVTEVKRVGKSGGKSEARKDDGGLHALRRGAFPPGREQRPADVVTSEYRTTLGIRAWHAPCPALGTGGMFRSRAQPPAVPPPRGSAR